MEAHIDLGGVAALARSTDEGWIGALRGRYQGFLTDDDPALFVTYLPRTAERRPWARRDGVEVLLYGAPRPERFGAVARVALPDLIGDGMVIHAALLREGKDGYLCCGPSGAGKSTLARLLPHRALCDELAVVRSDGRQLGATSSPFGRARSGSTDLRAVYLLRHGDNTRRRRLSPGRAMAALSRQISWPEAPSALGNTFSLLSRIVDLVPVWELAFVPTPDVWETISAGL